jgi:DNA recombination protein RmuC
MVTLSSSVFPVLVAFLAGALIVWALAARSASQSLGLLKAQLTESGADLRLAQDALLQERGKAAQLVAERDAARDQFAKERDVVNAGVQTVVGVAVADALRTANEHLVKTANESFGRERTLTLESVTGVVSPIAQEMSKVKEGIDALDKQRLVQTETFSKALDGLATLNTDMNRAVGDARKETALLAGVLKDNRVRGKWGEITLERTLELAGLCEHVSYDRQRALGDGVPDIIIRLPGSRCVPVDAKAPLEAYYQAMTATDAATQQRHFAANAAALRTKIKEVYEKGYHLGEGACDYSILYVPLESVLSAAASVDPDILEYAIEKHVLLASPLTLMAQLKGFALAWAWHKEQENAEAIVDNAKKLVERLLTVGDHLCATSKSLNKTVEHFNKATGSFDKRLVPSAQRILALSGQDDDIENSIPQPVEALALEPRRLPELPGGSDPIALPAASHSEAA